METPAPVIVLNGWAASPHAWDLCRFKIDALFSYVDALDGKAEAYLTRLPPDRRAVLVGWSMGGSVALDLAARYAQRIRGLVLIAAPARMMEDRATAWRGMSPRRLEAFRRGLELTQGAGLIPVPEGVPHPYEMDAPENLARGLAYLNDTDLRPLLERTFRGRAAAPFPVCVFQSERDGIVRPENADYLAGIFPQAAVTRVAGSEHALPVFIPDDITRAVARIASAR